jgi:hypothetical protein
LGLDRQLVLDPPHPVSHDFPPTLREDVRVQRGIGC